MNNMKLSVKSLKILLPVPIVMLLLFPACRGGIYEIITLLSSVNPEPVKEYIRSYGSIAAGVSFLLMIFQSIIAPLPAFIITFANAAVFGWMKGALLSWTSSMAGAVICFGIARIYGRNAVIMLSGKTAVASVENFFERYGGHAILIARLLPFMPFDIVSYGAGVTPMRFWPFLIATGIGQLPATLVYSYAGQMLGGGAKTFVYGLLTVFATLALIYLLRSIYYKNGKAGELTTGG